MMTTSKYIGCILMFLSIIGALIAFFAIDWTLGVLFCSFVAYRIGYFLSQLSMSIYSWACKSPS